MKKTVKQQTDRLLKFKNIALEKMQEFLGENNPHRKFNYKWEFTFISSVANYGICRVNKRSKRGTISISTKLCMVASDESVLDTILHEVAHARDYEQRNTSDHSRQWKRHCFATGANPIRLGDKVELQDMLKVAVFTLECPNCGRKSFANKLSNTKPNPACGKCCEEHNNGKFDKRFEFKSEWNPNRKLSLAVNKNLMNTNEFTWFNNHGISELISVKKAKMFKSVDNMFKRIDKKINENSNK